MKTCVEATMMAHIDGVCNDSGVCDKESCCSRPEDSKLHSTSFDYTTKKFEENMLMAWCNGCSCETLGKQTGVDSESIKKQYEKYCEVTRRHIRENVDKWKVGGKDVIVVIDSFPLGYEKFYENEPINAQNHRILAFAEIRGIPPKYFFEVICGANENRRSDSETILNIITAVVNPGSVLVVDNSVCNDNEFELLKKFYANVVTVDMLQNHNTHDQNVISNLEVVWRNVIIACDNGKDIFDIQSVLTASMWKQVYSNECSNMLARIICLQ